jgi:hypothetical protein
MFSKFTFRKTTLVVLGSLPFQINFGIGLSLSKIDFD